MAVSKLNLLFFPPKNPLPTPQYRPPQLPLIPFKSPLSLTRRLKTQPQLVIPVLQPRFPLKTSIIKEDANESPHHEDYNDPDYLSVSFPSLAFSNTFFFKGAYNFQVIVGDNEPEEELISRFVRESYRTRVIQECKRRRFFESTQDKKKRKAREAAKRNRRRRPQPEVPRQAEADSKKKMEDSNDDNWEFIDVDLPYC